jgi:hypothetical protein
MITIKLDVTKLQKDRFYHGKKGIYAELILIEHSNDFGDDGFVIQSISKEEREAGERGRIVGNWRETNKKVAPPTPIKRAPPEPQRPPPDPQRELSIEDDDIPF